MPADPENRQRRRRRKQNLAILAMVALLAGLIAWNALRPDPSVQALQTMSQDLIGMDPAQMSEAERARLQERWQSLPPEDQQTVLTNVGRARLQTFRQEVASLTPEQRRAQIDAQVAQMRAEYAAMSEAERASARQRLSSADGQRMVMFMMGFFDAELTARERAEMDPLLREWVSQINRIVEGQR